MMFYKNGGSDDFLRQSGMDMRKLGSSLGYTLPSGTEGPKTKTAEEIAAENLANFLFWTKPPAPPKPDKNQPFGTATYNTIISNLKKAAQAFAILFDLGAMTVKQYEQKANDFRGLPKQNAFTGQMMPAEWTVGSSSAFANYLSSFLPKATTQISISTDDMAAKNASKILKASLKTWADQLALWLGTTPAEFDAFAKTFEVDGLLTQAGAQKLIDTVKATVAKSQKYPQGHTDEVYTAATALRDKLPDDHAWQTEDGWVGIVKQYRGDGAWTYPNAIKFRDAVAAEVSSAPAKGAKPKESKDLAKIQQVLKQCLMLYAQIKTLEAMPQSQYDTLAVQAGMDAAKKTWTLAAVTKFRAALQARLVAAAANAQKIKGVLADCQKLFDQIKPLTGMTADEYNALAVAAGMDAATKLWTLAAATAFRDALQKKYDKAAQDKLDAATKATADADSIKKILADTDAYFATQLANGVIMWSQAQYDAAKNVAKGAGDWTLASATAFQKQVYALPITQITPTYIPPSGGGGGGGSSTGFGEGMALFAPPTPEKPPVVTPAAPPKEEPKSSPLPLLALLGAAAYALSK